MRSRMSSYTIQDSCRTCWLQPLFFRSHKCFISTLLEHLQPLHTQVPLACLLSSNITSRVAFFLSPSLRAGPDETDGQKAGENGHHPGGPEAAHPAASPAASRSGGSQDSAAPHSRWTWTSRYHSATIHFMFWRKHSFCVSHTFGLQLLSWW